VLGENVVSGFTGAPLASIVLLKTTPVIAACTLGPDLVAGLDMVEVVLGAKGLVEGCGCEAAGGFCGEGAGTATGAIRAGRATK